MFFVMSKKCHFQLKQSGIYFYTPYLSGTYFAVERFHACALQLPEQLEVLGLSLQYPAAGHADTADRIINNTNITDNIPQYLFFFFFFNVIGRSTYTLYFLKHNIPWLSAFTRTETELILILSMITKHFTIFYFSSELLTTNSKPQSHKKESHHKTHPS